MSNDQYIVVEWLEDLPEFPRYGFATPKHAEELGANVQCLQTCASLELAVEAVDSLNGRRAAYSERQRRPASE